MTPDAGTMGLEDLTDEAFLYTWAEMSEQMRADLPADVRARCYERKRRLSPYIADSVRRAERASRERGEEIGLAAWPPSLDLEALAEREPLAPRFLIPDWLPAGYATGLWGHGGAGKSQISLMLAVCIAAGLDFFGLRVARRRVLLLSCEDRADIEHWRLSRTCAHLGINMASLRGWLEIVDLVGANAVLWAPDRGAGSLTAAYGELAARMGSVDVLMVDGISDAYAGNENDKAEVKRFVNSLVALISAERGAVFLLGHVDKAAAKNPDTREGYSGTAGWNNAVRARWYLRPEVRENDDGSERTGAMLLELCKTNYGAMPDASIRLAWDDQGHLFTARTEGTGFVHLDRVTQEREEQEGIIAALVACTERGHVPAATSGRRTAYHVLSAAREFPSSLREGKPAVRRFWRHIEALRHRGEILDGVERGADRHSVAVLRPAGNAGNAK